MSQSTTAILQITQGHGVEVLLTSNVILKFSVNPKSSTLLLRITWHGTKEGLFTTIPTDQISKM